MSAKDCLVNLRWFGYLQKENPVFAIDKNGIKKPSSEDLTCEHGRRAVAVPATAQPMVAPIPRITIPTQKTDTQVVVGVAVDGPPEKDEAYVDIGITLPVFRDELMSKQVIQDVGVEHGLGHQLLAELVALDESVVLLVR